MTILLFFFFQAEDGIRDVAVTGVQTCALPICRMAAEKAIAGERRFITQSRLRSYQPSTSWYTRSDCSYSFPWCASRDGRRKRLHNIGVRVSDTSPDTRMAEPMVTANSWNNRPTIPPMKRDRKSTRLNSSHGYISYAVFCLKKKKKIKA